VELFLTIWTIWVSKDAEFYVDFKNINLPCDKMHLHKVIPKKHAELGLAQKRPNLACFLGITFSRCILS
jgi:hypothetical protein